MKSIYTTAAFVMMGAAGLLLSQVSNAQADLKNWNTAQLNLSFTKKLDLRLTHLRSFDISNGYSSDFNQSSVHLDYDLTKKLDINAGYTFGGSSSLTDGGSRVSVKLGYKLKLAKLISWFNSVQGEKHAASETRYRYRIIWNTRISPVKRFKFLRLSPSAGYSLFYNIGGSTIQYYDSKSGLPTVRQTPDGLHRGRLMLSLNSKITKQFSVSVYYMTQREFNLFTPENRRMNIIKPTSGRVVRAFDNFNVIGLTLQYDINIYAKHRSADK